MDIIYTGRRPASLLNRSRGLGRLGQPPAGSIEVPFPEAAPGTAAQNSVTGYIFEYGQPYAKVYYSIGANIAYLVNHLNNGGKTDFLIDIATGATNNGRTDANEITGQRVAAWTILANPQWAFLPSATYCIEQSSWTSACTRGTGTINGKAVAMGNSVMVAAKDVWGDDLSEWDDYAKSAFELAKTLYESHDIDAGTFEYKPTVFGTLLVAGGIVGGAAIATVTTALTFGTATAGSIAAGVAIGGAGVATGLYLDIEGVGVDESDTAAEICRRGAMYWGDYCANGVMKSASAGKKVTLVLPKKDMDLKELLEYRYKTPNSQFILNIDTGYGVSAPGAPPPEETAATLAQVVKETSEAALNTSTDSTLSDEKKFPWGLVIGGVAVIGLGVGGYLFYKNSKK